MKITNILGLVLVLSFCFITRVEASMPKGSFLKHKANSVTQLTEMVRKDHNLSTNLERALKTDRKGLFNALKTVRLRRTTRELTTRVYYLHHSHMGYKTLRIPRGTKVFAPPPPAYPLLLAACGNPVKLTSFTRLKDKREYDTWTPNREPANLVDIPDVFSASSISPMFVDAFIENVPLTKGLNAIDNYLSPRGFQDGQDFPVEVFIPLVFLFPDNHSTYQMAAPEPSSLSLLVVLIITGVLAKVSFVHLWYKKSKK